MTLYWPPKAPGEVLDYMIDWSQRLTTGDSIASSIWAITSGAGLTINSNQFTNTPSPATKVFLSSGTLGVTYQLLNTITTANGDTMQETVTINIASK